MVGRAPVHRHNLFQSALCIFLLSASHACGPGTGWVSMPWQTADRQFSFSSRRKEIICDGMLMPTPAERPKQRHWTMLPCRKRVAVCQTAGGRERERERERERDAVTPSCNIATRLSPMFLRNTLTKDAHYAVWFSQKSISTRRSLSSKQQIARL